MTEDNSWSGKICQRSLSNPNGPTYCMGPDCPIYKVGKEEKYSGCLEQIILNSLDYKLYQIQQLLTAIKNK
jgi:hypothetical protein